MRIGVIRNFHQSFRLRFFINCGSVLNVHFVIMGCGRVGATLAVELEKRGHSVAVIDQDAEAFRRLPPEFAGQRVTGVGFDRDALRQAGIEDASGFAACSSGDNSNIIAARVVRDSFGVKNVVTRIYDSSRAVIYNRLGVDTVAPVRWSADHMMRALIPLGPHTEYIDSELGIAHMWADVHESWYGLTTQRIEEITESRVAYLSRNAQAIFPAEDTILQDGDGLFILVPRQRTTAVQRILNHPLPEEQR